MNIVDTTNNILNDLSVNNNQNNENTQELGQSAFLELMITQLENQNPLDPQENSDFIAQLAQFSSVESLDLLNNNFQDFSQNFVSNQALQASTLVGRSVTVPGDTAQFTQGGVVDLTASVPSSAGSLSVSIFDSSGSLVDQIPLDTQPAGDLVFRWDGRSVELNGARLDWQSSQANGQPSGQYRFDVSATIGGEQTALATSISANVNSVTLNTDGSLALNLAGMGTVSLADVRQFNE